ncbi:hypothetical protein BS17DRAFT_769652 [Gyrodon lividus]|nr:hypothetical protein BS17DRAFT_769652 [Gyrodon lividus]
MPKQKGLTLKRIAYIGHSTRKKARYDLDQDNAKENNAPATMVSGSCATSRPDNLPIGTVLCQPEAPHSSNSNLDHDTLSCGLAIIAGSLFGLSANEDLRQEEEHLIWGTYQKFFVEPVLSKDAGSVKGNEPEQLLESMQVYEFIQESGLVGEDSAQEDDSDDETEAETETEMETDEKMEMGDSNNSAAAWRILPSTFRAFDSVKQWLKIKKTPHLLTAKRWMRKMGYCWTKNPAGQYVDGHEHEDVVWYQQTIFLPAWQALEDRTRKWLTDNIDLELGPGETATPHTKGKGASLMVADFVSADHGWLRSLDGKTQGRNHAKNVMAILNEHYHDEDHVLVFDNATTHLKCADNALSARKMPKGIPKNGGNWGFEVNQVNADGKPVFDADGKICKIKVSMSDGRFDDGTMQPLYFPPNDLRGSEGIFKGMAVILKECKHKDPSKFTVPTTQS